MTYKMMIMQKVEAEKGCLSLYQQTYQADKFVPPDLISVLKAEYLFACEHEAKLQHLYAVQNDVSQSVYFDELTPKQIISQTTKAIKRLEKEKTVSEKSFAKKKNKWIIAKEGDAIHQKSVKAFNKWLNEQN